MNSDRIFELVDRILPFEVCLYHQVIPLNLDDDRLELGMVDVEDAAALSYVRQLLKHLNRSLVLSAVPSETLQKLLSSYLNHCNQAKPAAGNGKISQAVNEGDRAKVATATTVPPRTVPPMPPPKRPTTVPTLEVQSRYQHSRAEVIAILPPTQLLEELLCRVLDSGIGRLYFERHEESGKILWSQDGEVQSAIDSVPLPAFQGTINELKKLMGLPLIPVERSRQAEIERQYQNTRLLLRLRVMRGDRGEEATLQILRGAALKFYQQQKLADLSRDALTTAHQLHRKLHEIRARRQAHPNLAGDRLDVLPALEKVLHQVQQEIAALKPDRSR